MSEKRAMVIAKILRSGLGNRLLVWGSAKVFAKKYNLPFKEINWHMLQAGPFIRKEADKRMYFFLVKIEGNFLSRLASRARLKTNMLFNKEHVQFNPAIDETPKGNLVVFDKLAKTYMERFDWIVADRDYVRTELWKKIKPKYAALIKAQVPPVIGIHMRLGDFRPLKENEQYNNTDIIRADPKFFIPIVHLLREGFGYDAPVTIFTDGDEAELAPIFALPNVSMAPKNPSIVDMYHMSMSKVFVASTGSSFSQWAVFLGDGLVVLPFQNNFGFRGSLENEKANGVFTWQHDNQLILEAVKKV